MVDDAHENEEKDREKKRIIESRNKLDSLVYQCDKTIKDNGDKISEDDVSSLSDAITSAREALDSDDADLMISATESLESLFHEIVKELYASSVKDSFGDSVNTHDHTHEDAEVEVEAEAEGAV